MLDRQSRVNRHIKASRPEIAKGVPGVAEGSNGDVTYRQVGNSLSQYVKKDNKWHEISGAAAAETQIITISGGTTTTTAGSGTSDHDALNNLTSGDDHTQYVHNTTARTITAQHNFTNATAPFSVTSTNKVTNLNADRTDGYDFNQSVKTDGSPSFVALTLSQSNGTTPMTVTSSTLVSNLNADKLDGYDESAFFKLADSETVTGIPAFNGGTSGASAPFTVDSTDKVANLNADLLDGFDESAFFKLADNETVTGVPAFNGGTSGASSPFSVDSTYKITNLNADLLDGYDESAFFLLADDETVTGQPSFNGGDGSSPPFNVDSGYIVANLNADKADGYHFNQDVRTTASPSFVGLTVGAGNIDLNSSMTITGNITGDSGDLTVSASSGDVLVEGTTFSANNVVIPGNLTVSGDTVTMTTSTVQVEDQNIQLAYNNAGTTAEMNAAANAGGVSLKAAEDKHFVWYSSTDRWTANEDLEAPGLYLNTNTETKITLHDTSGPTDVTIGTSNAGDMILTAVSGQGVTVDNNNHLGGTSFVSGFAGSGWRVTKDASNEYSAEFDNLIVRGTMSVYELLIQQIRATNGSIMVTSADKVVEISDEGSGIYKFTIEADDTDDFIHFTEDDLIIAQKWAGTSGEPPYTPVKRVRATVTETSNSDGSSLTGQEFLVDLYSSDTISAGDLPMDFVRIGNTSDTDRQGGIYLTSEDSGAPFIDIFNDVASWPDWRDPDKTKARLGKLDGITHNGTNLNSYGLFSDRVYLTGNITATSGYIGSTDEGWTIASDQIHNGNFKLNANDETLQLGTITDFTNDDNTKSGIYMGKDGGNYEFFTGKEATEYVWWDGTNLNVKGIITVTSGSNVEAGADVTDYTVNNTDANLTTGTTIDAGGVYIAGTAGKFTVSKTSNVIDYDAAEAVFLGVHGSTGSEKPKLSLKGGASDGYLKWDGDALSIKGSITITGWSDSGDIAGVAAAQSTATSAASAAVAAQSDATQAIGDAAGAQGTADGKVTTFFVNDAPTAEGVGDLWMDTNDGNKLYRWNGSSWAEIQDDAIAQAISDASDAQSTADGKIVTFYQTDAPTATSVGDLWVDTDDGNKLYRASAAGSANWVTVQDTSIASAQQTASQAISDASGAQGTADGKVTTFFQDEPPTSEGIGDLWLDTNDGNKLYRATVADSSTDWTEVQDDGIAQAILDASDAQSTADGKIVSFYQTEPPTATSVGDLWVDTNDGNKLYRATAIGTGDWVEVQDDAIAAAQDAADDAQDDADTANSSLSDIAADNKVTPNEKLIAKVLWDAIEAEKPGIVAQASTFAVSSTAYVADYDSLDLYLNTTIDVFDNMTTTVDITRATWESEWGDYYGERQTLLNALTGDAEAKADTAKGAADDAQEDADAANDDLSDIADDSKVTPDEKLSAKVLYDQIVNEYSGIIAQALSQVVSSTAYTADYDALVLYIGTTISVFSSMSATTDITRSDWTTAWGNYYTERQTLLNAIVADAESKADQAQSDADARATTFREDDVPDANAIGDIWYDTDDGNKMYVSASATSNSIDPGEWELFNPSLAVLTYDVPAGEGSGLYMDSTHLGYFDDSTDTWKTYMQNNGNFYLDGSGGGLSWIAASSALVIQGDITAESGYIGGSTGWFINAGSISNEDDGKVVLDAANELIRIGNVEDFELSAGAKGILMGKNPAVGDNDYELFVGKENAEHIHWDGANLNIKGVITVTDGSNVDPDADETNYDTNNTQANLITGTTITGGGIQLNGGGSIRTNSADFGDDGIFFGYDTDGYKMSCVNSSTSYIKWNGSNLEVKGTVTVDSSSNVDPGADVTNAEITAGTTISSGGVYVAGAAGKFTINSSDSSVDYDQAESIFIGMENTRPRLSLKGGASDGYLTWNGDNLAVKGNIYMDGGTISWSSITGPDYGDLEGTVPPNNADNTASNWVTAAGDYVTHITSSGIYTGILTANQIHVTSAFSSTLNWNFRGSIQSFSVDNGTFTPYDEYSTLDHTGSGDSRIVTPAISIDGRVNRYIKIKFRRQAGTGWDGRILWNGETGTYSNSRSKLIPETGQVTATTIWSTVLLDMFDLDAGQDSWEEDGAITSVRFDFGSTSSDEFDIEFISIGDLTDSPGTHITADGIYTGTLSADQINAGTIVGRTIKTASSGERIEISNSGHIDFYEDDGTTVYLNLHANTNNQNLNPGITLRNGAEQYWSMDNSDTSGTVSSVRISGDLISINNKNETAALHSGAVEIQNISLSGDTEDVKALWIRASSLDLSDNFAYAIDIYEGQFQVGNGFWGSWFGGYSREVKYAGSGVTVPSGGLDGGVVNIRSAAYSNNRYEGTGQALRIYKGGNSNAYWSINVGDDNTSSDYALHLREPDGSGGWLENNATVNNITFTGQHRCKGNSGMTTADYAVLEGYIVSSSGVYDQMSGGEITIDEALPVIELSSVDSDKKVFGVVSGREGTQRTHQTGQWFTTWGDLDESDERIMINSLGEGGVWITNINGSLDNGDYITSSTAAGLGQKQDDDLLHNYTVAKITQDCDFSSGEDFEHDGVTYKKQFVGCTYHCG